MRLFIAIDLPKSFKKELARLQLELKRLSEGGRFVPQQNFHITLHFIGESNDLAGAVAAMREAARGIRPFTLHLGKYGRFEKSGGATSFVEVKGELAELGALYESLQSALYDNGFSREHKGYAPHVTLGRGVLHGEEAMAEMLALRPNASMTVQGFTLFESARREGRVVYTPLHTERF